MKRFSCAVHVSDIGITPSLIRFHAAHSCTEVQPIADECAEIVCRAGTPFRNVRPLRLTHVDSCSPHLVPSPRPGYLCRAGADLSPLPALRSSDCRVEAQRKRQGRRSTLARIVADHDSHSPSGSFASRVISLPESHQFLSDTLQTR
jgi:hypothetical protein